MSDDQFRQAEDKYYALRGQLENRRITRLHFEAALRSLMIQDAEGHYWALGGDRGKWYVYDGQKWVASQPPGPGAPSPLPPLPQAMFAAPPPATMPTRSSGTSAPTKLLIGLGVFLIVFFGFILLLGTGTIKLGADSPRAQQIPTQVKTPTVEAVPVAALPPTAMVIIVTSTPLPTPTASATPPTPTLTPTAVATVSTLTPLPSPTVTSSPTSSPAATWTAVVIVVTATPLPSSTITPRPPTPAATFTTSGAEPTLKATATHVATATRVATASSTATATRVATATPAATATPSVPPGVYVTAIRTEPAAVKSGESPTFLVTFLNTLGVSANYNWYVKIFEPDKKQSFGETAKLSSGIVAEESTLASEANWRASGSAQCRPYIARIFYVAPDNAVLEFPQPGGGSFYYYFQVCV